MPVVIQDMTVINIRSFISSLWETSSNNVVRYQCIDSYGTGKKKVFGQLLAINNLLCVCVRVNTVLFKIN